MNQHAIDRAKERYGLDITVRDLSNIRYKIKTDEGMLLGTDPLTNCKIYAVRHRGEIMRTVVNDCNGDVVTFISKQAKLPKRTSLRAKNNTQHKPGMRHKKKSRRRMKRRK